jgi:predicted SnoaL-like aldol condensation-catalyzing enzyme
VLHLPIPQGDEAMILISHTGHRVYVTVFAMLMTLCYVISPSISQAQPRTSQENKQIVVEFYSMAFEKKLVKEAFETYVGDVYIQHNPRVPDGKEAAVKFLSERFRDNLQRVVEIKRVIGEGGLVAVHVHSRNSPEDRGVAIVDIFRVEQGKIIEHWDVLQPVPETAANQNTMF